MHHTTTVETDGQHITTEDTYSSQLPDGTLEVRQDNDDAIVATYPHGVWASVAVTRKLDTDTEAG